MSNEEEQSDEIMALQSIYGEEICICNPEEKPIKGTILVDIDIGLENYEFLCDGDLTPLKHLSPVILNFSLPSNYPHESLPDFTLSCIWLTDQQLENLSNILKDRWKESCSVILYAWIDFLKSEIFNMLDIKFPLEISQTNMMRLIETNRLREEQIFETGLHLCPVCFIEYRGINCIKLSNCEHVFCKECLENYLSVCISSGNVNLIICPDKNCDSRINHHTIKNLVSESLYERYDQLLLRKSLSTMSDVQYCPRANCGQPAIVDDENDSLAFCHACNFAFCIKCNSTYHGVNLCKKILVEDVDEVKIFHKKYHYIAKDIVMTRQYRSFDFRFENHTENITRFEFDGLVLAKTFMQGNDGVKRSLLETHGKKKVDSSLSEMWSYCNSRKCPHCGVYIQKISGCDHMLCRRCRQPFSWMSTYH